MEFLDMSGEPSPIPVEKVQEALAQPGAGGADVLVGNISAVRSLEKLADSEGYDFSYRPAGESSYRVALRITAQAASAAVISPTAASTSAEATTPDTAVASAPATAVASGGATVLFTHAGIGGEDEPAKALAQQLVLALSALPQPPQCLIFMGSGCLLATQSAATAASLSMLAAKGCEILCCGASAKLYGPGKTVGATASMQEIAERLTGAQRLVSL